MDQLRENIDAGEVVLTKEILKEIEDIQSKYPDPAP
jgi:aryl-alcohol dehydrogenase-like predicted oxidoreductase